MSTHFTKHIHICIYVLNMFGIVRADLKHSTINKTEPWIDK